MVIRVPALARMASPPRMTSPPARACAVVDHRTRVGRERRARTQARILETALGVFAAKGPSTPVIDDFIKAAGVARGTFYNYYESVDELLEATTKWLEEDLMMSIERELDGLVDPVDRLMLGVRLWLHKAASDKVWCAFVARSFRHGDVVEATVEADLRSGLRAGGFSFASLPSARDVLIGTLHESMRRMAAGAVPARFTDDVARLVFRALGVSARRSEAAMRRPLPPLRRATRRVG
mgnify:CR=1 FL=1